MFEYISTALKKIGEDFKRIGFLLGLFGQLFYIAYLVYSMLTVRGIFIANVVLCAVSLAYLVFYIATYNKSTRNYKNAKKTVRRAHSFFKLLIKLITLGMMLYSVYYTVLDVTVLSVVFTALSIVSFILQFVFELVRIVIENRIELLVEGIKSDVDKIKKPFETAKRVLTFNFKKEEPVEPSKFKLLLDKRLEKEKEKKENENKND